MKNKLYFLILIAVVAILYLFIKMYFKDFDERIYGENKNKLINLEFKGSVNKIFRDRDNRDLETFLLVTIDSTFNLPSVYIDRKYRNYLKVGDSLIKKTGSLEISLYRENSLDTIVRINSRLVQK